MTEFPNSLFSEAPVWMKLKNKYAVGLIDLLLIDENRLIITDYKLNEKEMIRDFPQIFTYGIILRDIFLDVCDVRCAIFNRELIWEFDPNLVGNELINFLKIYNSRRDKPLLSQLFSAGLSRTNLLEDIKSIFQCRRNIVRI